MSNSVWVTLLTGLIAGLGIGSAVTAVIQYGLRLKEVARQSKRRDLEARYKVIILLMYAAYDFAGNETTMRIRRPDLTSQQAILDELRAELINMLLFASKATLQALRSFFAKPTIDNLVEVAENMRSDLARGRLGLKAMEMGLPLSQAPSR